MPLQLVTGQDNEILRTVSKPVTKIDSKIKKLVKEMEVRMIEWRGVGLAAPQVGLNLRIFTTLLNVGTKNELIVPMINPEIISISDKIKTVEEGCLSLPGLWGKIKRSKELTVRFQNLKGDTQTLNLEGFNAQIIQHEMGHLDAELYIDKAESYEEKK